MQMIEAKPIDRDELTTAIYTAVDILVLLEEHNEDMVGIVAGGLYFLITGEDGVKLSDSDMHQFAANGGALAEMLFNDLEKGWQGFPSEEDRKAAWKICDTIAAAYCKFFNDDEAV